MNRLATTLLCAALVSLAVIVLALNEADRLAYKQCTKSHDADVCATALK